jgi:hypothetical protein
MTTQKTKIKIMKNLLKFATTRRIASLVAGVAMVGMLVGGNMGTAFASDPTFSINGTPAAMTPPTVTVNSSLLLCPLPLPISAAQALAGM